jgi:hypothetical protein
MMVAALVGLLLFPAPLAAGESRIQMLLIGQVTPEHCPAPIWLDYEPLVEYSLVPTKLYYSMTYEEAQRFIRIYLPRNREDLQDIDFFMFINPYFEPFTPVQIENLRAAIVEDGSGAFQTLGGITIDWTNVNWPWVESTLAGTFPNDTTDYTAWEKQKEGNLPYRVVVNQDGSLPPVLKMFVPLGIERVPGYWTIVLIVPQDGATTWARADGAYPKASEEPPAWLLSWTYGEGMTWSVADDLDCPWWADTYHPSKQEYGLDILVNIVLHSLGRPLPEDIVLVNAVRQELELYNERRSSLSSFFEFVERFGVSSTRLLQERLRIDGIVEDARSNYIDGYHLEALELTESAHEELGSLETKTMRLKDQAHVWVYLIEWAAVTGTSMIAGYVLYMLLVRRKLYREVEVTRMRES